MRSSKGPEMLFLESGNDSRSTRTGFLYQKSIRKGRGVRNWTRFSCLIKEQKLLAKACIPNSNLAHCRLFVKYWL
jgi:hypothetical protein